MQKLTCFKAYDIRGQLGSELDESIAYRIGRAYAEFLKPHKICIGGDVRATTEALKSAVIAGLCDAGVDVIDLGVIGTEEVYFATHHYGLDGGIMITASHNPIDYNGMKMVRRNSRPISNDNGLQDIQRLAEQNQWTPPDRRGTLAYLDHTADYLAHILSYLGAVRPLKLVVNAGNGAACATVDRIEQAFAEQNIPITLVKLFNTPDPTFPNGIPNPILVEQQAVTGNAVVAHQADMGIAWDGDFDRCFFWDHTGRFIEGYYVVGLLAEAFLLKEPGAKIVHDTRLVWNTQEICQQHQGQAIASRTGHAFIKEVMAQHDAIYGGEMSAHHYFRDFAYCDSGMIPWLLVVDLLSRKDATLADLVSQQMLQYPSPGEINSVVVDAESAIRRVYDHYAQEAIAEDHLDGIALSFPQWRFNLRQSNTEPVVRLNLETRNDPELMRTKTHEILSLLRQ